MEVLMEGSQMLALGVVGKGMEKIRRKDGGLTTKMEWSHTFIEKKALVRGNASLYNSIFTFAVRRGYTSLRGKCRLVFLGYYSPTTTPSKKLKQACLNTP
jgi:hypothetical protein